MTAVSKTSDRTSYHQYLSPIEEVVEDARNGRMFILVDAEERENEGDLVIPAQLELAAVFVVDPLEEVAHSPVRNLIHNYRDRVAFCVTTVNMKDNRRRIGYIIACDK